MRAVMKDHLGQDKAMADVPLKGPYVRNDVHRSARALALPYAPAPTAGFSSVTASRMFWWLQAEQPAVAGPFAKEVFRAHHARTDSPNTVDQCVALAASVGADVAGLAEAAQGEAARQALRDATQAAVQAGVWGTPTVRIGEELFWGSDRLPMVDEWLRKGGW
ncbi:hypothetical protein ASF43_00505 [Pseudorhodoferax sp. Leaf267]|nr:hypothetical protein ASF43_00505 [Pseudorhodoferax sp. Leaf267]